MATATNTLTRALDFTVEDWHALPRNEEPNDPGFWTRWANLGVSDADGGTQVRLFATAERPVPVVDVWTVDGEMSSADVRAVAAALLHVASVVDEIARREAL